MNNRLKALSESNWYCHKNTDTYLIPIEIPKSPYITINQFKTNIK